MQLEHSFTVPVGVDEAWQILTDLGAIAPSMPGSKIVSAAPGRVEGTLKVKLGPVNLNYTGVASLAETDAGARRAVVHATGDSARNGTANATVHASLAPDGEATTVTLSTELEVTGKPSQFGHSVMSDVGTRVVGQFATSLGEAILAGRVGTAPTPRAEEVEVVDAPAESALPESPIEASEPPAEAEMPPVEEPVVEPAAEPVPDAEPVAQQPPVRKRPRPRRDTDAQAQPTEDASADEPRAEDERVETAAIEAEAAAEPAPFVAQAGLPPVTEETIPSVNGHGSPTPPTRPPSADAAARGLADLARPALVRGVAPVTLAVIFVLGALRRRRRG